MIASRSRRISSNSARARIVIEPRPVSNADADAGAAEDHAAGRKIRPRHDAHQLVQRRVRIGDQRQRGVDDLAGIVRRDVGRHADGDAVAAVDQQVGEARRQDARLLLGLVVVRLEIDRVLVDVVQQQRGGTRQPHFGVAHRRRVIAVDRAEIALPVDQRHAHRERLRHAHHGVVDRRVAVRVVLAHHVADHAGGLAIRPVRRVAGLLHAVTGCADAPASARRARPAARAPRSRSWRNRGRSGASPPRGSPAGCPRVDPGARRRGYRSRKARFSGSAARARTPGAAPHHALLDRPIRARMTRGAEA